MMDLTNAHSSLLPLPPSPTLLQSTQVSAMGPGRTLKKAGDEKGRRGPYKRKPKGDDHPAPSGAPDANKTSTSDDLKINKDKLVEALQSRIEVPIYGIGTLRRYLEDADYVQDVAYNAFMADFRALGGAPMLPPNSDTTPGAREGLPDNIRGALVVIHGYQEEQRREAMRLLRAVINIDRDPNNRLNLTLTEAFFTLVLTGWDVEAGALRWASEDVIRWQIHHTFDHLRPSTTDQVGIDERTARFVHFTGRDDWHSIRDFLAVHNQQFMRAVRAWYRSGMPVVRTLGWNDPARLYVGRRVTHEGHPRSSMPSNNGVLPSQVAGDFWAPDEVTFRPTGEAPGDSLAQPLVDLHTATKRKRGFCFTPEGDAPQAGGILRQQFTIDYLQNGKYVANGFPWKNWYRPELPESAINQSTNPQFNQHNRDHVAQLGRWIRQQRSRAEGILKKATPQDFTGKEKKFLFELCKRHLEKILAENPGKTAADFRPLNFRDGATQRLENDFNEAFEGKVFPGEEPGMVTEPRRRRLGTALKVKCGRMKKFRETFGFKNTSKVGDGDGEDSPEWSDDDDPLPSGQLATPCPELESELSPTIITGRRLAVQRRQANMAEEDGIPDLDARVATHRRYVRAEAHQHYSDSGALFPSEAEVADRVRLALQAELRNGKITAQHAAVVRRLMRSMGMVPVEERDVFDDAEEMEVDEAVDEEVAAEEIVENDNGEDKLDDEVSDFETLDWTGCFPDDILGDEAK